MKIATAPIYVLSLPERTLRVAGALAGGLLREVGELALPAAIRDAALYRATAGVGLRFLIEQLGDVRGIYSREDPLARRFVVRYAIGSSIETLALLNFYLSPVWVLAALGDATRASKTLYVQIGDALKREGLLERGTRVENMVQFLDGLERTSTHLAMSVNMPPLDPGALRREWTQFRMNLAKFPGAQLPSAGEVERSWSDLQAASLKTDRSPVEVAAAMAIGARSKMASNRWRLSRTVAVAARTAGAVVGGALLEHYTAVSREIAREGFSSYWDAHSRPYLVAAARNLLPKRRSWTERLLVGWL